MFLRKQILFFLLFITVHLLNAQNVPGYLGKKGFVDYNFTAPFFTALPPKYTNFIHSLNFNYVFRRRAHLGVSYDFFGLKETNSEEYQFDGKLKGNAFGVNFDWYNRRAIAPIGRYFRIEGKYLFGNYNRIFWDGTQYQTEEKSYSIPTLAFGLGTRRIFFDRMVYNVGGSIGYAFGSAEERDSNAIELLRFTYFWRMHMGIGILLF